MALQRTRNRGRQVFRPEAARIMLIMVALGACALWTARPVAAQPGALRINVGGPYMGVAGQPVQFNAEIDLGGRPPGTAYEVQWDFGDGTTGTGESVSHVYAAPGSYAVTATLLVLAGQQAVSSSTEAQITGGQLPGQLTVSAGGPYTGVVGQPVFFSAQVGLGGRPPGTQVNVTWDFGDGTTGSGLNTQHVYGTPGFYSVTVTASVGVGQSATSSTTAQIAAAQPAITASAGGPYSGTVGQPITMTASVTPAGVAVAEWIWNFGDGTTASGQTVQKTYNIVGTFNVTVEVRTFSQGTVTAFTTATVTNAQQMVDVVSLPTGCSNQALTWRIGTPLGTVAAAISPPGVLLSIFKLDPVQQRFRGFSPTAPSFANDYNMVETSLEAVFFCVSAPATLSRPLP